MANVIIDGKIAPARKIANLDANYGPYESLEAAQAALAEWKLITPGLTVGIEDANGNVTEYWWQGGTTINHLVPKQDSSTPTIFILGISY